MLAILADAVNILGEYRISPNPDKRNSFNEASSRIFAKGIGSSLSFDYICDALGFDAESMRKRLSELVSVHVGNFRRLRLKRAGGRARPINRVRGR